MNVVNGYMIMTTVQYTVFDSSIDQLKAPNAFPHSSMKVIVIFSYRSATDSTTALVPGSHEEMTFLLRHGQGKA